jgi:SAM-dependent methyltransferase
VTFAVTADGPNGGEIDFWNGPQGRNWVTQNFLTDRMYDPFGAKAIERASLKPGEQVIEVGCGCGKTTGKLADLVAPGGRVTALDVSVPMLEVARSRVTSNAELVDFVSADAATYGFEPNTYDVLYSQFGLMFFVNPDAAFSNFFRALKPNGRLVFVCWRRPELNPWLTIPFEAVHSFVPDMPKPSPDVPSSAFTLAPEKRVKRLLGDAGFEDVLLEEFNSPTRMGQGDLDACLGFVADFSSPVAAALRKADPAMAPAVLQSVRSAVAPNHNGDTLELPASAWIVSARRP